MIAILDGRRGEADARLRCARDIPGRVRRQSVSAGRRVRRPAGLVLSGLLALSAAGCAGSKPTPTTPTTPTPTASATALSSVDTAVLAAYDGMWSDLQRAALTANFRSPLLAAHTVDPATGQLQRTLLTFYRLGWVAKGSPVPHPHVVSLTPSSQPRFAVVADCVDETHWLTYYARTGKLTDNRPGQRFPVTAQLRVTPGGWRVESYVVGNAGAC